MIAFPAIAASLALLLAALALAATYGLARLRTTLLRKIAGRPAHVPDYRRIAALEGAENTRRALDGLRNDIALLEDALRQVSPGGPR